MKKLYKIKDKKKRKIFGVCAGLSEYTGIKVIWLRILFFLFYGIGTILYIVLACLLPYKKA